MLEMCKLETKSCLDLDLSNSIFFNRDLLAYVYIPVIGKELEVFRETIWNSHRVRCQKGAQVPKGIPKHLYAFPEQYEAEQCGMYSMNKSQSKQFKCYNDTYHTGTI